MAGSTTFHSAEIGGVTFEAILSMDGPYIQADFGRHNRPGVALGDCTSIATFDGRDGEPAGTFVIKYTSERRIALEGFGDDEIAQFEEEFGICTRPSNGSAFYRSRAGQGLAAYVQAHPRRAKEYAAHTSYLGNWYRWAVENAPQAAPAPGCR